MNTNEWQSTVNQTEQLTDLSLNDEQTEEIKGGTLKYNFGGIEGAASASRPRPSGASMQDTEKGVTGMFA